MRWKVNILIFCTFVVSIYCQMVAIDEHLDTTTNVTNSAGADIVDTINDRKSIVLPITEDNKSAENEIPQNVPDEYNIEVQPIPDRSLISSIEAKPSGEDKPTPGEDTSSPGEGTRPLSEESGSVKTTSEEEVPVPAKSNESAGGQSDDESVSEDGFKVVTTHGPVEGHLWNELPEIIGFLDIPYGHISTMFEAPQHPDLWEEVHSVSMHGKRCPQLQTNQETRNVEVTGDIDCLTLSVFVPKDAENASVLFHVHDGSFTSGSGDPSIYGPEHLISRGIILVLPNYRLGPLGFLCLQNETAPGNAALKDLTLALNWTKANIAAFGGNPENIVVSGDGKSGALAGYLALSPASKEYVTKVIAESGSVISHWAIDRDPITIATTLAEKIRDLYKEDTFNDDLFSEVSTEQLLLGAQGLHLRPCIENGNDSFISESPWYIIHDQKIDIPFMIGSASYAGLHETLSLDTASVTELNEHFGNFLPEDLIFESDDEKVEVGKKIKSQYFGEDKISANSKELALFYTDSSYMSPVIRTARVLMEAGATVYFYEFAFVGAFNRERIALGSEVNGSARGDIIGYLFTQDGQLPDDGSKEEEMINLLTELWISFINNGIPSSTGVEWKELESKSEKEEEWLWIGSETQARKGLHVDRLQLWTKVYDEHFVEKNVAGGLSRSPSLIFAVIYLVGLFSKAVQVAR